jgi:hypothetical protein
MYVGSLEMVVNLYTPRHDIAKYYIPHRRLTRNLSTYRYGKLTSKICIGDDLCKGMLS